jgi:EamA domain-containing membrane protein RarD
MCATSGLPLIALSIVPAAIAGFLLNPLVFLLLGPDTWRERIARIYPYRWWIAASLVVLGVASTVYGTKYA